jgi:hypothetical protein
VTNEQAEMLAAGPLLWQWIAGDREQVAAQLNAHPPKVTLYFGARLSRAPKGAADLGVLANLLSVVNRQPGAE